MPFSSLSSQAVGGMYAELDHMGPSSPSEQPLISPGGRVPAQQQVMYSDLRNL